MSLTDAVVIAGAVGGAYAIFITRFPAYPIGTWREPASIVLAVTWLTMLRLGDTRAQRVLGVGFEEFRRVIKATLWVFGLLTIAAVFLGIGYARVQLMIALPIGLGGLLITRVGWRLAIWRLRAHSVLKSPVLVVGSPTSAVDLARVFVADKTGEFEVVGLYVVGESFNESELALGGTAVPVICGDRDGISEAVGIVHARAVAVTASEHLHPSSIKQLTWDLEERDARLIVAAGVTDIALPRMVLQPVGNVPMLHVDPPRHSDANRLGKAIFDRVFAVLALILFAPLMIGTAIVIKATSRGPVFYCSERIGIHGKPFQMIKFRSMVPNAEAQVFTLIDTSGGKRDQLLFKMPNDPRVTGIGRIIRRLSIDELPQFINVLKGEMSVVGPRPPLAREVAVYTGPMRRRLLVRPGVTGLWQVSGRSDLTVEQAMQLDQYYVDNWSMLFDLNLIGQTARAVLRRSGAY